jgi:hypothetical protein
MAEYDNTDRGALFKNDRKEKESHPDYKGSINVGGVEFWLSAWIKEGAKGKFMSLSVQAKDAQTKPAAKPAAKPAQTKGDSPWDDMESDIPF